MALIVIINNTSSVTKSGFFYVMYCYCLLGSKFAPCGRLCAIALFCNLIP